MTYRVFTLSAGTVEEGAGVQTLHLKGAGVDIPAVMVGEEGRGRSRGVVPIGSFAGTPCPRRGKVYQFGHVLTGRRCSDCGAELVGSPPPTHPDSGWVWPRLRRAGLGQTKAGNPKFVAAEEAPTDERVILVFRTPIGYRGGNSHTGDRCRVWWTVPGVWDDVGPRARFFASKKEAEEAAAAWAAANRPGWEYDVKKNIKFHNFPGEIIARGIIADGAAGRMGSGEQFIALVPKDAVFRTAYTGRLYGAPPSHYYKWDGEKLLSLTWEERAASDLF